MEAELHGVAAANAQKQRCERGHELSGENCYVYKGHRICRACKRASRRRWRREHPEAWARSERERRARKRERERQEQLRAEMRPLFQQLARRLGERRY